MLSTKFMRLLNTGLLVLGLCGAHMSLLAQTYSYDNSGRLQRVIYPSGEAIVYVLDDNDNITLATSTSVSPPMPVSVESARVSPTEARITWAGVDTATGYRIERRIAGSTIWTEVGQASADGRFLIDSGLQPGIAYDYRVRAFSDAWPSAYSESAAASLFGTPSVFREGVVNGASFQQNRPISRGSIISLFGSPLGFTVEGSVLMPFEAVAEEIPLPRKLNGVSVLVEGIEAPLFFVGGQEPFAGAGGSLVYNGQINAQVPLEIVEAGLVEIVVRAETDEGILESEPVDVAVDIVTPSIFTFDFGPGRAAVLNVKLHGDDGVIDNSVAQSEGAFPERASQPAPIGGIITIFCNGLGATTPSAMTGENSVDTLRQTVLPVKVFLGGVEAQVDFAGLAPEFVGLYQINAYVPEGVTPGDAVPLVIEQDGRRSREDVTIAVRQP
jgi:uncharacterized protein (TIGR03437 family)